MSCRQSPSLLALVAQLNKAYPNRDNKPPSTSDGGCGDPAHAARNSDHNPDANGFAHAQDIDEDLGAGLTGDAPLMPWVPLLLADNRTKYVIYERTIWYRKCNIHNVTRCWQSGGHPYNGVNAHAKHLHLSILDTATHISNVPWAMPPSSKPPVRGKPMYLYKLGINGHPDNGKVYTTDLIHKRLVDDDAEKAFLRNLLGPEREQWMPAQLHDSLPVAK